MTGKKLQKQHSTLVINPTGVRPWVGLYQRSTRRFMWRSPIRQSGPGKTDLWRTLRRRQRNFPTDRIVVVTGPGSFTLTRSAVNIANALGFTWNCPVQGIDVEVAKKLRTVLNGPLFAKTFAVTDRAVPFYSRPALN